MDTYFTNYNDWYNGTRQKLLNDPGPANGNPEFPFDELGNLIRGPNPYVNDEAALKTAMANDLRQRGGADGLSDDQVMDAYKRMGGFTNVKRPESSFGDSLKEFASPLLWMGSMAAGGPVAGAIAGANGSGATSALGVNPALTNLAALGYGAYQNANSLGSTPSEEVAGSEYGSVNGNAPNADYWNKTYAANDTGTMTDATQAGGNNMGDGIFDDFTGQWSDNPGYSQWDYTSPDGWSTNPSIGDLGGNIDPNTGMPVVGGGLLEQAMATAKRFGTDVASALKMMGISGKDVLGALGRGAPAALGALGANQQATSLRELSDKYMALGAPSRDRYEASFAPGFTMANDPGYQNALDMASKANLHGLSVQGNPALSPNAQFQNTEDLFNKTAYPALQNYRNTNANAGGIASLQTAAPGAASGAIGAQANVFNAAGAGLNDIFNPPKSLAETLADYRRLMAAGT